MALVMPTSQKMVSALIERRGLQPVQAHAEGGEQGREHDLTDELGVGLELDEVVDEADQEHAARAAEEQHVAVDVGGAAQEVGDEEADEDADAAEERGGLLVPAVGAGPGHQAEAARRLAHQERGQQGQGEREAEARRVPDDVRRQTRASCLPLTVRPRPRQDLTGPART